VLYQIGLKVTLAIKFFCCKVQTFEFSRHQNSNAKTEDQNNKELSHILRQKH